MCSEGETGVIAIADYLGCGCFVEGPQNYWFDADGDGKPEVVYYNGWRGDEHIVSPKEKIEADEFTKYEGSNAKALGI